MELYLLQVEILSYYIEKRCNQESMANVTNPDKRGDRPGGASAEEPVETQVQAPSPAEVEKLLVRSINRLADILKIPRRRLDELAVPERSYEPFYAVKELRPTMPAQSWSAQRRSYVPGWGATNNTSFVSRGCRTTSV